MCKTSWKSRWRCRHKLQAPCQLLGGQTLMRYLFLTATVAWTHGLQVGWPGTSAIPSWPSWSPREPITWTYAAATLRTPNPCSKLETWSSATWSSGLKWPGATEVVLQQLRPLCPRWLCRQQGQALWHGCLSISLLFPPPCCSANQCLCPWETQRDGERSLIINFSWSAWLELPPLVCFPLKCCPFSWRAPVLGFISSLLHLLVVLAVSMCYIYSGLNGSAVNDETPAAFSGTEFQTPSAGAGCHGRDVEIMGDRNHISLWRLVGKLAVPFVKKLNSPYPLEWTLEKK